MSTLRLPSPQRVANLVHASRLLSEFSVLPPKMLQEVWQAVGELAGRHGITSWADFALLQFDNIGGVSREKYDTAKALVSAAYKTVCTDSVYLECVVAYNGDNQTILRESIPDVFNGIRPYVGLKTFLHGITLNCREPLDAYFERVKTIQRQGILPSPYGVRMHYAQDKRLRAVYGATEPEYVHGLLYLEVPRGVYTVFASPSFSLDREVLIYSPSIKAPTRLHIRPYTQNLLGDAGETQVSPNDWKHLESMVRSHNEQSLPQIDTSGET